MANGSTGGGFGGQHEPARKTPGRAHLTRIEHGGDPDTPDLRRLAREFATRDEPERDAEEARPGADH